MLDALAERWFQTEEFLAFQGEAAYLVCVVCVLALIQVFLSSECPAHSPSQHTERSVETNSLSRWLRPRPYVMQVTCTQGQGGFLLCCTCAL